jgi:SAM-dependent methyltransferase
MSKVKKLNRCLCCDNNQLELVFDLGRQPLANSFKASANEPQETFPLAVQVCKNCWHMQLTHAVDPEIIFKNYLYVSGTSRTMIEYFDWFAEFAVEYMPNNHTTGSVLEIGCNDGSQLNFFKKLGYETWGIDPAENIYPTSSKNHNIICDFLNKQSIQKLPKRAFDIIYAQNVFAHNDNPLEFLQLLKTKMDHDSLLFIQNSQCDMIVNREFDTIYHEHRSFYTHSSMKTLCERADLNIIDFVKGTIHGGSGIYVISKAAAKPARLQNLIDLEAAAGLHSIETYRRWASNNELIVNDLVTTINYQRKNQNRLIVGYGAPAKGMTLINYGNIELDFIIDDAPLKQGKFTPGMNTLVVGIDELEKYKHREICFVPLAWNFFDEIVARIKRVRDFPNDKYIRYFPTIQIL